MNNIISELRVWFGLFTIPKNHRLPLLLAFLTGVLAYAIFIFHHLLDDHGNASMPWIETGYWGYMFGRWTASAIVAFGYNADIPVINALIGVLFLTLAGYYSLRNFIGSKDGSGLLYIFVSLIVVFPINLTYFFYTYSTTHFTASIFFAAVAARSCCQGTWFAGILGFASLLLMWTTYQAAIGVFLVVIFAFWISKLLKISTDNKLEDIFLPKNLIRSGIVTAAMLILSITVYATLFKIFAVGIGHASPVTLDKLFHNWMAASMAAFQHLWTTQPDLPKHAKFLTTGILSAAFLGSIWVCRKSWTRLLLLFLIWPACVISTKAIFFIINWEWSLFDYRTNPALGFLYAFAFWVVLHISFKTKWIHMLLFSIACFTVLRFVQIDLVRQIVNKRGETHDLAFANRILTRIEALDGLDSSKTYRFVRIGEYPWYRREMMQAGGLTYDEVGSWHMESGFITSHTLPNLVFNYLGSRVRLLPDDYPDQPRKRFALKNLLENRQPYPGKDSIFLFGDTIYVYLNRENIPPQDEEPKIPIEISVTQDFKNISDHAWKIIQQSSSSIPCWFAIKKEKETKNKKFVGSFKITSDKDINIAALLCSQNNDPFEGTIQNISVRANKAEMITIYHRFTRNVEGVKLQFNVAMATMEVAHVNIENVFIAESF
jgi:hypothetical protein